MAEATRLELRGLLRETLDWIDESCGAEGSPVPDVVARGNAELPAEFYDVASSALTGSGFSDEDVKALALSRISDDAFERMPKPR